MYKILVNDIETYAELFYACFYDPEKEEFIEFEISAFHNDLYKLTKFCSTLPQDLYIVNYNGVGFDSQVLTWILRNYESWWDLSSKQIVEKIYDYSQDIIDRQKYDLFLDYKENNLFHKDMDLFKIHHLDRETNRVSLKWCAFMMDEDVEEMPIHHGTRGLTPEDIQLVKNYCKNDMKVTYELYRWTVGDCENKEYKGKNKITDRLALMEEIGLPCMNWSDVKIGEEWNRKDYLSLSGRHEKTIYPKRVRHFFGKKYKEFFPKTVEFQSDEVKGFVYDIGETFIINEKQEFKIKLGENLICIGRGGLHSSEKPRKIVSDEFFQYIQTDIGSQYPNAYCKYGLYPLHLGPEANTMVVHKIQRRLEDKRKFKETKEPKYDSLQAMGKLSLNGGLYGKLKQQGSFLEDHICQLKITIGCQLEILMIVEALVLKGFRVVSCNTDGFDTLVEKTRMKEFKDICSYYEEKIGNKILGNLEHTHFNWIAQTSVNDYIAEQEDGDLKKKGDFLTDYELKQNKSRRIIPLALEAYFRNGVDPEEFIMNHTNPFDFMIGVRATKDYHFELVDTITGEREVLKKLVRYYISIEGKKLLKIKNPGSDAKGNDVTECEAPDGRVWLCTIANKVDRSLPISAYRICHEYYIRNTQRIIMSIEKQKKITKQTKLISKNQLNLF